MFITGVTVVRTEFLNDHPESVQDFIVAHHNSVVMCETDLATTADRVVELGIIAKAPLAQKAIPLCNIVCITGSEIKPALSGYLQTLFDANPKSVGGAMPGDDFYYAG